MTPTQIQDARKAIDAAIQARVREIWQAAAADLSRCHGVEWTAAYASVYFTVARARITDALIEIFAKIEV